MQQFDRMEDAYMCYWPFTHNAACCCALRCCAALVKTQ